MTDIVDEHESIRGSDPRLFAATLDRRPPRGFGLRLSGPMGIALHALAILALVWTSLTSTRRDLVPRPLSTPLLQFAPPPPPPHTMGTAGGSAPEAATAAVVVAPPSVSANVFAAIPDRMPVPVLEISEGIPDGFSDGDRSGLTAGMAAGVVGGVPGGLVGGVVGGTGTEVPDFPKPDVGPAPIRMPKASYSEEAIRQNITGSVHLLAVIDHRGTVEVLEVTRSIPELDAIAIRTVETSWRFEPATKNGRPISCVSNLVVRFNLR